VQIPDDEKFEVYLRRFDPIAPEPIPAPGLSYRSRRSLRLGAWLAACAAIAFVVGAAILHHRGAQTVGPKTHREMTFVENRELLEPLTMRGANTLLSTAPSFKAAIDGLAFPFQSQSIPNSRQSAIAVLSKEKIKL
jgi:hypothetical protein